MMNYYRLVNEIATRLPIITEKSTNEKGDKRTKTGRKQNRQRKPGRNETEREIREETKEGEKSGKKQNRNRKPGRNKTEIENRTETKQK